MSTEATKPEKLSYKQTLNLPQTSFPMEAKLTANEPARLKAPSIGDQKTSNSGSLPRGALAGQTMSW